jgi:hypothetical protein
MREATRPAPPPVAVQYGDEAEKLKKILRSSAMQ